MNHTRGPGDTPNDYSLESKDNGNEETMSTSVGADFDVSAAFQERQKLFPDLYKDASTMVSEMEKYAVERPQKKSKTIENGNSRLTTRRPSEGEGADAAAAASSNTISTRQQPQIDIWGRVALKEPAYTVDCVVCHRPMNTLRYAQHLDKCLGLGTMARSATGAPARNTTLK